MKSKEETLQDENALSASFASGLIDVPYVPPRASARSAGSSVFGVLGGALAFLVVYAVVFIALEGLRVTNVVPLVAAVVLALWLLRSHMRKEPARIAEFCNIHQYAETPKVVSRMVAEFGDSVEGFETETMFEILRRLQRFGTAVRIGPPECLVQISPFEVPFEPIELGQTDEARETLAETPEGTQRQLSGAADDRQIRQTEAAFPRKMQQSRSLKGRYHIVKASVLAVIGLVVFIATSKVMALVLALAVIIFELVANGGSEIHWLLSPGGLVIRKDSRRSARAWRHQFTRDHAVLVVHRSAEDQWTVVVGDSELMFERMCPGVQVDLLLRGWLSSLDPLPSERYGEFGPAV